jgi:cytochrome P450
MDEGNAPLFDPFAPGFTDDPYPQYAALRERAPVYRHPMGFWVLRAAAHARAVHAGPGPAGPHRLRRLVSKAFTPRRGRAPAPHH